jgi:Leucine-rich repeat (LRR) protein
MLCNVFFYLTVYQESLDDMGLQVLPNVHTLNVSFNSLRAIHNPSGNSPRPEVNHEWSFSLHERSRSSGGCWRGCALRMMPALTMLDVSHNNIIRMTGLEDAESLKKLFMTHNSVRKMSHLETLVFPFLFTFCSQIYVRLHHVMKARNRGN